MRRWMTALTSTGGTSGGGGYGGPIGRAMCRLPCDDVHATIDDVDVTIDDVDLTMCDVST